MANTTPNPPGTPGAPGTGPTPGTHGTVPPGAPPGTPHPPARSYRYSVKFVCGKCEGKILARGHYFTAINVHNPSRKPIKIHKVISTALPGEMPGHVVDAGWSELGPLESFEIDCPDVHRHARLMPGCLAKGFVILTSRTPLEVVAVYTAAGADKEVETLHTERVPPLDTEGDEELPNLVPLPPHPQGRQPFPSGFCKSRVELEVFVKNLGPGDAPASTLRVEFLDCNQTTDLPVNPLPANQQVLVPVPVPPNCWHGEILRFKITANALMAFPETDMSNNSVMGQCHL